MIAGPWTYLQRDLSGVRNKALTNLANVLLYHYPWGAIAGPLDKHAVVTVELLLFCLILVPKHPPPIGEVIQGVLDEQTIGAFHHQKPFLRFESTATKPRS